MLAGVRPHPNPPPEGEGIYIGWELGDVGMVGGLLGLGIGGSFDKLRMKESGGWDGGVGVMGLWG